MGVNIEIKARANNPQELLRLARAMSDRAAETLEQHDVFFRCGRGMLKLRRINGAGAELIAYEREHGSQPRPSRYDIARVADFDSVRRALGASLGEIAEVRKTRTLLLVGRTRIHLDRVEGLGEFLELEVVLGPGEDENGGRAEAEALLIELGVASADLLDQTYAQMLSGPRC